MALSLLVVLILAVAVYRLNHHVGAEAPVNVKVDPLAVELAEGKRRQAFGIVLTSLWRTTPQAFQDQYTAFRQKLLDDPEIGPYVYVYPYYALHCTVASLSKFTTGPLSSEAGFALRAVYERHWRESLDAAFHTCSTMPTRPFSLVFKKPSVDASAGIIMLEDATGHMANLRDCIRQAAANESLPANNIKLTKDTFHIPGIVHSSFMRFRRKPPSFRRFRERFAAVAASWVPVEVQLRQFSMTREIRPYMHVKPEETSAVKTYTLQR